MNPLIIWRLAAVLLLVYGMAMVPGIDVAANVVSADQGDKDEGEDGEDDDSDEDAGSNENGNEGAKRKKTRISAVRRRTAPFPASMGIRWT